MSNIVKFPGNKKTKSDLGGKVGFDLSEHELIQEWLTMLKGLMIDLDESDLSHPLYLKTYLSLMDHSEIIKMGQFLGFTDLQFHREEELIDFVALQYQAYFPEVLKRLPYNAMLLLRSMVEEDGRYEFEDPSSLMEVLDFIHLGIGFLIVENQEYYLVLHLDIMEQLEHVDWEYQLERAQLNTDLLALTQGMLFSYGVMSTTEVLEMLEELMPQSFEHQEALMMLMMQCGLGATFLTDGQLLWDNLVEDPQALYGKIIAQQDLERKKFTKSQLIAYANRPVTYSNNLTQWLQKGHRELPKQDQQPKILIFNKGKDQNT